MDYISDQEFVEFLQYLRYRMDTDPGSVNDILDKVISDANICKRYVDRRGEETGSPFSCSTVHHLDPAARSEPQTGILGSQNDADSTAAL